VRPDDLVGVEGLVAVATEVQRSAVRQHFNFDFARQRINRLVIGARLIGELQEQRPPGGEIGMGAFVERTFLVRDAARNDAPEAGEGLQVQVILDPSGRTQALRWPAPGSPADCHGSSPSGRA
jgi:hypothetical protein